MRTIQLPELKFSNWFFWENRKNIPLVRYPGVYAISITSNNSLEGNPVNYKDVSYIGMTNSKGGLLSRWNQFFNSINGKSGHSGGKTVFLDLGNYKYWKEKLYLYVAAMGIECNVFNPTDFDYIKMGWIAFLEYEAFSKYYIEVGGHPKYNKK